MNPPRRILVAFRIPEALRDVLAGITAFARKYDCNWQIFCADADALESHLTPSHADGALIVARAPQLPRSRRIPVVNMVHDLHPRLPSVLSDDRAIGRIGAEYLLSRGFCQLAFLPLTTPWSIARQEGFDSAIRAANLSPLPTLRPLAVADFQFISKGRATTALRRWLGGIPPRSAVMAPCDFAARTLLDAALALGLNVPRDLAILGVDNFPTICRLSPVPLSSIAQNFEQIGFHAAALLHRLMSRKNADVKNPAVASPILIPPGRIFVRASTDLLAFEDPALVAALRLIHEQAAEGISIKRLLRHVPISRRWLDQRFTRLLGHTASQEIRRCRLQHVRDLLDETDLPLRQIAQRCQFSCAENLIRWFRAAAGVTPSAYRRRHH